MLSLTTKGTVCTWQYASPNIMSNAQKGRLHLVSSMNYNRIVYTSRVTTTVKSGNKHAII